MTVRSNDLEATLERVLREGSLRLPVGRNVPALPATSPLAGRRSQWSRRTRRGVIGAGVGLGLLATGAALAAASSTPPRVFLGPTGTVHVAAATVTQAVRSAMPPNATVEVASRIQAGAADYDEVKLTAPDGVSYTVNVYHHFDAGELDGFGLPRSSWHGGTRWIGAYTHQARSVYYLSPDGVGVAVRAESVAGLTVSFETTSDEAARVAAAVAHL